MSKLSGVHAKRTAAGIGAVTGLLCMTFSWAAQDDVEAFAADNLTVDRPLSVSLSPGETHRYTVQLNAGRNQIRVLETGIDVALSVHVDGIDYEADSPTARFALEPVWFDLIRDSEATVTVYALRQTGVPTGDYTIDIESGYAANEERLVAESLTKLAIDSFNQSYGAGLSLAERDEIRSKSLDTYIQAATTWEDLGKPDSAAYSWHAAGFISSVLMSQHANAQMYLERAARNYGEADLDKHRLVARKDVGQAIYREERYSTAAAYLAEMAELAEQVSPQTAFVGAVANNELCLLYKELGNFQLAISHCERAMAAFDRHGDVIEYNNALHNLAIAKRLNGDQDEAIELLYNLLDRHQEIGEPVRYAQTLTVLASSLIDSGNIDAALSAYDRSIDVFEQEGLALWQAVLLSRYARIERMLGRDDQARRLLERALGLVDEGLSPRWEGQIIVALTEIDLDSAKPIAAIPALQRAVNIFRQIESIDLLVSASVALANAQLGVGWTEQARATVSALGDVSELRVSERPKVHLARAKILNQQESVDQAIDEARRAALGFEETGDLNGQLEAVGFEAKLLAAQARWDESLDRLESLRILVRRIGRTLILPQLKARFFSQQQSFYEELIQSYDKVSKTEDEALLRSLNALEEARATALRAYLEAPSSWLSTSPPEMRTQYDSARQRVAALVQDSFSDQSSDSPQLMQALHQLERIQNAIWRVHTRYADVNDDMPFTWEEVDRSLDARTAILYFYIGASKRFGVLIEQGRRTRFELVADEPLEVLTQDILEEFRDPNSNFGLRATSAKSLSAAIFQPVVERLDAIDRLVIVPDAGLHNIPLAALPHPLTSQPMLQTHQVSSVASLQTAIRYGTMPSKRMSDFSIAAIGDPVTSETDSRLGDGSTVPVDGLGRLRGTRDEILGLKRIFGETDVSLYTGFDARKSLFTDTSLSEANVLHISAHGVSNETLLARSGIFLSTMSAKGNPIDGHLGIEDLFGLDLDAQLVVLSGCETSLGENLWSEGPLGVARAFQYSGVPSVVATLWRIDDRSSATLTQAFYERLSAGDTVPAALRSAQLAVMQNTDFRHPYYWAAFQAMGAWSLQWEKRGISDTKVVRVE